MLEKRNVVQNDPASSKDEICGKDAIIHTSNLKTVLVADTQTGKTLIEKLLSGEANIIWVNNFAEANQLLNQHLDLIICGLHFADSYMFDLLRRVKANAETKSIPFLCFNVDYSVLSSIALENVNIACKSLGAEGFTNFPDFKSKYGEQQAEKYLQNILLNLLTPHKTKRVSL